MTVEDYAEILHQRKDLTMGAKTMMFDLIMIWNRWREDKIKDDNWNGWFHATDHGEGRYVIGERWGTATYARYRKELIEKNCIAYERGFRLADGKGIASRYKLLLEPVQEEVTDSIFDYV